jgi:hypothetical protein
LLNFVYHAIVLRYVAMRQTLCYITADFHA